MGNEANPVLTQTEALARMATNLGLTAVPAHWQGRTFADAYIELTDAMCLTLKNLGKLYVDEDGSIKEVTRENIRQKIDMRPFDQRVDALCRILTTPTHKSLYAFIDSDEPEIWRKPLQDSLGTAQSPLEQAKAQGLLADDLKSNIPLKFNDKEWLKLTAINKAVIRGHYLQAGTSVSPYTFKENDIYTKNIGYSNRIKFLHRLGIKDMSALDEAFLQCAEAIEHENIRMGINYTHEELGACAQAVREYRGLPLRIYEKVKLSDQQGNAYEKQTTGKDNPLYEKRASIAKLLGCGDEKKDAGDSHIDAMIALGRKLQALDKNALHAAMHVLIKAKIVSSTQSKEKVVGRIAAKATALYPKKYNEYRRDNDKFSPALITLKDIEDYLAGIEHKAAKIFNHGRVERTAQAIGVQDIFVLEELGKFIQAGVVTGFSFNTDGTAIAQFKDGVSKKELDTALKSMGVGITSEDDYLPHQKRLDAERRKNGPFIRGIS